jgi:hypothetical protein
MGRYNPASCSQKFPLDHIDMKAVAFKDEWLYSSVYDCRMHKECLFKKRVNISFPA